MTIQDLVNSWVTLIDAATSVSVRNGAQSSVLGSSEIWIIGSRDSEKAQGIGTAAGSQRGQYDIEHWILVAYADTAANITMHTDLVETVKVVIRANPSLTVSSTAISRFPGSEIETEYLLYALGNTIYRLAKINTQWYRSI